MHALRVHNENYLDQRDLLILADRIEAYNRLPGPRVGDYVRFAGGVERRISHLWTEMEEWGGEDSAQTSDGGSYYLGRGYVSMSGSLFGGTPLKQLRQTNELKDGSVWFFHHDYHRAHNGVNTVMPFRVFETDEEAPR